MIKKTFSLIFILGLLTFQLQAQRITPEAYIELYKDVAIQEMKRMGVPAAITLAQGLLETEGGNSILLKKSNNHFGIKCKSNWTGAGVSHDDDAPGECFRVYTDARESYRDHSDFLRNGQRYAFLFNLSPTDYKGWAYGLKKAGYATNPKYPAILIRHIEQYDLQKYSLQGASSDDGIASGESKDKLLEFDKNETIQAAVVNETVAVPVNSLPEEGEENYSIPGKVMVINGSKCILVKKGTSLLAIASQHRISLRKLLAYNELEEDGLLAVDQLIFLQKKAKTGERDFVVVKQKETLYDVAQQNGIQLEHFLAYNKLDEDGDVFPGTKLYLKPIAETLQARTIQRDAEVAKEKIYQVQPREGLYAVAKKHGVSVQQLKEWNNLTSNDLKIGQELIVRK